MKKCNFFLNYITMIIRKYTFQYLWFRKIEFFIQIMYVFEIIDCVFAISVFMIPIRCLDNTCKGICDIEFF